MSHFHHCLNYCNNFLFVPCTVNSQHSSHLKSNSGNLTLLMPSSSPIDKSWPTNSTMQPLSAHFLLLSLSLFLSLPTLLLLRPHQVYSLWTCCPFSLEFSSRYSHGLLPYFLRSLLKCTFTCSLPRHSDPLLPPPLPTIDLHILLTLLYVFL